MFVARVPSCLLRALHFSYSLRQNTRWRLQVEVSTVAPPVSLAGPGSDTNDAVCLQPMEAEVRSFNSGRRTGLAPSRWFFACFLKNREILGEFLVQSSSKRFWCLVFRLQCKKLCANFAWFSLYFDLVRWFEMTGFVLWSLRA